jgi:predicted alpha/beta superfamily hydrolase
MRALLLCLALLPLLALARPEAEQKLGRTLVDEGSAHYRFERFALTSADGARHYRVQLAIPRRAAPPSGYPVLYLLDGNAALMALREDWLAELQQGQPPLLAMIGPASELRLDLDARVFDYTPRPPGGVGAADASLGNRSTGGAAAFRELLASRIKPEVARRARVDAARQGLWGHSLGGLFVLDSLRVAPGAFRFYVAASPSLWWQSGLLLERFDAFAGGAGQQLLVLQGGSERSDVRDAGDSPRARAMAAVPEQAARQLSARLDLLPGLQAQYREFAGLGHGPMLAASLRPTLRLAAGLAPFIED